MLQGDKFCSSCTTPLEMRLAADRQRPVCPKCGRVVYYDPKIAATCVIERGGEVLLVRRGNQPGYGLWSMPGGYVDRGEVVEAAAAREVSEEAGLEVEVGQLIGLFSEEDHPVVVAAYTAREVGGELQAGSEALEVAFFPPDQLPDMAFPRDHTILEQWGLLRDSG